LCYCSWKLTVLDALLFSHAPQRAFQPAQWAQLGKRLDDAQGHLRSLLDTIKQLQKQSLAELGAAK